MNEMMNMLHNAHDLHHLAKLLTILTIQTPWKFQQSRGLNGKTFNETFNNCDQEVKL